MTENQKAEKLVGARRGRPPKADAAIFDKPKPSNRNKQYIRFRADSEARSKAIYEAYTRWCDDNAQKPMSANRVSSELAQNELLYNVEATNNVHVGGKRVRGFVGIEVVNPPPY